MGFLIITGQPAAASLDYAEQERLLAFFDLPEAVKLTLARHQNNPANGNIYRGWFPALAGERSYKEGIDIGPEALVGDPVIQAREPLLEPNQWPSEAMLPGWREAVLGYSVSHRFRPKRVGQRVSGVSSLSGFESRLMLYGI